MPYPRPRPAEKEKDFIDRCMADDVMKTEMPDIKNRAAVCYVIYEKRNKKS